MKSRKLSYCHFIFLFVVGVSSGYAQVVYDEISGASTSTTGINKSYYYQLSSGTHSSPQWTAHNGTVISSSTTNNGTRAIATVRWDKPGTGVLNFLESGYNLGSKNVSVTCSAISTPTIGVSSVCSGVSGAVTAVAGTGGNTVRWYSAASGGTKLFEGLSYTIAISSSTSYYISTYNTTSTCEGSRVQVTITANPTVGVATGGGGATVCSGGTADISATPGTNGTSIRWYSSGGVLLQDDGTSTYTSPVLTANTTYYAESYNATTGCYAATRLAVPVTVIQPPTLVTGNQTIKPDYNATVTASTTGTEIRWYAIATPTSGETLLGTGSSFTTPLLYSTTSYYSSSYSLTHGCETNTRTPVTITVLQEDYISGPGTRVTGTTGAYYYVNNSDTFTEPVWTVTKGTVISSGITQLGARAIATIRWDTPGTGTIILSEYGNLLDDKDVVVSCAPVDSPTSGTTTACNGVQSDISAVPGSGGNVIRWYDASSGGTELFQGNSYPVTLTANTRYYISTYDTVSTCESSRVPMDVSVQTLGVAVATDAVVCSGYATDLTATPGANGTSIRWYGMNGALVQDNGTSQWASPPLHRDTVFYAESYNSSTGCYASLRDSAIVSVLQTPPIPSVIADKVLYGEDSITIKPAILPGNLIRWYTSPTPYAGESAFHTGNYFTTPILTNSVVYYLTSYSSVENCESVTRTPVTISVFPLISPSSSTHQIVRREGVRSPSEVSSLTSSEKNVYVAYYDGLSRTHQGVNVQSSPSGMDIVQFTQYDQTGNTPISYLPYVANTTDGSLKHDYLSAQLAFYNASGDKIVNDPSPFSKTVYETSPLGRPLELGGVGAALQPGTSHTVRIQYGFNSATEVRHFRSDGTSTGFYAANLLHKIEKTNEDNDREIAFSDEFNNVIFRKVQLDDTLKLDNNSTAVVDYLETYYIYDDLNRIKFIVSPKGVADLKANGWSLNQSIKDQYTYHFEYDNRGRLVAKKNPGQAWTYHIYDDLNRLVLSQDGLLRAEKKWIFIKYDEKGRAVMTGSYQNTTDTTRVMMQNLADALYTTSNATYPVNSHFEHRGTTHGYNNASFPKIDAATEVWTVNYYESYDFDYDGIKDYQYDSLLLSGQESSSFWRAKGLPTGSKRLILDETTPTWLYTYLFYDSKGRLIQTRSNNHMSSAVDNLSTLIYDFEGKLLSLKKVHRAGGSNATTVSNTYSYDPKGRLVKIYQNNNDAPLDQLLVQYEYNELGQLVDKKLHYDPDFDVFLQSVDYRYTIQGGISSINNAQLNVNSENNDDSDDYFGMEFLYHTVESGLANNPYYSGKISAVKWKGVGSEAGTGDQKSYKYLYDKSDRLRTATSQVFANGSWTKETGAINESMLYDHNGNIKVLQRNQPKYQLSGDSAFYVSEQIDRLTYVYSSTTGDRLTKITDEVTGTVGRAGFNNGSSANDDDYTYDINGNALSDSNKGITGISYNLLGKPTHIVFSDGREVIYTYDGAGNKLKMKMIPVSGPSDSTQYVDGFIYHNDLLSFFGTPEGRVVNNNGNLEYQYGIADHQGNTRVVFTSATPAPYSPMATFEGDAGDDSGEYEVNPANVVSFISANHTPGGSKVVRMNQTYKVGPSKSIMVYPGDKVDIEVWEYHEGSSGFGTGSTSLNTLVSLVAGAFGGVSGGPGESGMIYSGVDEAISNFLTAGNQGDGRPAAYLNYILLDKDFNVLDMGWQLAPASTFVKQRMSFPTLTITQPGYVFVYLSYDNDSNNWVYFDDLTVTHTKTNVIQYNEYYPFGLQTGMSWTREGVLGNNFLSNGSSELVPSTGWFDLPFRNYDPAIGRMMQVDPMASLYPDQSPYHYSANNPVMINDPTGAYYHNGVWVEDDDSDPDVGKKQQDDERRERNQAEAHWLREYVRSIGAAYFGQGWANSWSVDYFRSGEGNSYYSRGIDGSMQIGYWRDENYIEYKYYINKNGDLARTGTVVVSSTFVSVGFASGDGFNLQYSEGLDQTLSTLGGVAGAFESGAAIGTFQSMSKLSFSTAKAGLKVTKGLGAAGGVLTLAVAGHEVLTGHDNTHTLVDIGVTALGIGAAVAFGTVALPAVAIGGLAYGIWSFAGGSDWIDKNWGYRDPETLKLR